MTVKCKCNNCDQNIEFDSEQNGATVKCPSCGLDTLLFSKPVQFAPKIETRTPPRPRSESIGDKASRLLADLIFIGWVVLGLIITVYAVFMETSVPGEGSQRIINSGLTNDRLVYVIVGVSFIGIPAIILTMRECARGTKSSYAK